MRFTGEREVDAPVDEVWSALHDGEVLRRVIPGCEALRPLGAGRFAATLAARVGPVADTYRGSFSIDDLRAGSDLVVRVEGRGRCGRLDLDLRVGMTAVPGRRGGHGTRLSYDARAGVSGLVARLGSAALTIAGGHLTGCFFRDLDRVVSRRAGALV